MLHASRAHLAAAGETYFEHMRFAATVGLLAVGAGVACLVHAIVPALCEQTCSRTLAALQHLFADRRRLPEVAGQASGVTTFVGLAALTAAVAAITLAAGAGSPAALLLAASVVALPVLYLVENPGLDPL